MAPLHATFPKARVDGAILVAKLTLSVPHSVLPMAVVLNTFLLVDVLSFTVAKTIQDITLVGALVWPSVRAFASDFILLEFTAVNRSIGPFEDTTSPEKAQAELALVLMAILELASTISVVHFAYLN